MTASAPSNAEIIAILRGLQPERAIATAQVLLDVGIRSIEVPLNSPEPFKSITLLAEAFGAHALIGAGTVLSVEDVHRTHAAGGRLIVAPNCDPQVIAAAAKLGLRVLPGIATATEAFVALRAGASGLKLYPAASLGMAYLRALRDVLPATTEVYPVGGITAADIPAWLQAGAAGFGLGSELFKPVYSLQDIAERAQRAMHALGAKP
jgi:2-dehydro-3-deoxyphosphogalactonate aldolase